MASRRIMSPTRTRPQALSLKVKPLCNCVNGASAEIHSQTPLWIEAPASPCYPHLSLLPSPFLSKGKSDNTQSSPSHPSPFAVLLPSSHLLSSYHHPFSYTYVRWPYLFPKRTLFPLVWVFFCMSVWSFVCFASLVEDVQDEAVFPS